MAGKRKREESLSNSPRRRSARISDMRSSASGTTAPLSSVRSLRSREMSALTGVSELSTEEESPVRRYYIHDISEGHMTTPESWTVLSDLARRRVNRYETKSRGSLESKLTACLLACIDHLPDGGRESLARNIRKADTDDDLHAVFSSLCTGLLCPMKANSARGTITPSPHSQGEENAEMMLARLLDPNRRSSEFRDTLLRRDDYRCVVSNQMDQKRYDEIGSPDDINNAEVEGAHIIPFNYGKWKDTPAAAQEVSKAWEVLWRYFPAVRRCGLNIDNINDPSNGMTLSESIHRQFGRFSLAFIATEIPNTYRIKTYHHFPKFYRQHFLPPNDVVTFQAAASDTGDISNCIPPPNPIYLECHYRIAEILNASGMGKAIDQKLQDLEDLKSMSHGHMAQDGSTDLSRYLNLAFWQTV
ncbi:hypothetical protein M430DRAFT_37402 [Amorphotheca resinae ATCC 22711]|uniref:HNH nuclease domain-containing protein n=1 Tax=Amorphotheca resinae ATCC 22711 TaxID=857342 RepID=A0A2T3AQQ0_AMORE|nr:hypothetical protein M430DRAFT_37402 [Amorphotheca resinae ATCC 22711]PSS08588.1 hypothetical protein M430DRAFT_37402 [Amorphotheca resinae ATCC 22711]